MSENHAGDEMRGETAPIQPLTMPNPLAPLVVPGLLVVLILCGVIFGVMPMWNTMGTTSKNLQKMSKDSAESYSHTYQAPPVAPPIYVPGNNPNGPFTPSKP